MRTNKSKNINEITHINGPVNLVRLEGYVAGNKKVLYLFLDFHEKVETQTQCKNLYTLDVNKYLIEKMRILNNSNKKYDFFIEIVPSDIVLDTEKITNKKQRYIDEVMKNAIELFTYDKENDLVYTNNLFKNVRLHYLDIRIFFGDDLDSIIKTILNKVSSSYDISDEIPFVMDKLMISIKIINKYINLFKGKYSDIKKDNSVINPRNQNNATSKYLINKITTRYKHSENKKKINDLFKHQIEEFVKLRSAIKKTISKINKYSFVLMHNENELIIDPKYITKMDYGISSATIRTITTDIINMIDNLYSIVIDLFARFTDIYFLRRFLDKDYITNAVVYCGAMHSITYIDFLVKKYNFQVTHAYYHKYTINDTNEIIKKISLYDVQELFYPKYLSQCINIENFPDNFE